MLYEGVRAGWRPPARNKVLKTEICDTYQINESDFMRRAIAESVQSHIEKTQNTDGKFLFV